MGDVEGMEVTHDIHGYLRALDLSETKLSETNANDANGFEQGLLSVASVHWDVGQR